MRVERWFVFGLVIALNLGFTGSAIPAWGQGHGHGHGGHGHSHGGHGHGAHDTGRPSQQEIQRRLVPQPMPLEEMNLDFEDGDTAEPWILGGRGYSLELDESVAHSGEKSLRIRFEDAGRFAVASMPYDPKLAAGKRLRISGYVKTEDVKNGYVGLWGRVDVGNRQVGFDNMADRGMSGDLPWTRHELVFDVPEDANRIFFGAILTGIGTGWVDHFTVTTEEIVTPTTRPVQGKIARPDGASHGVGMVALAKPGEPEVAFHGMTDGDGKFDLGAVATGSYALTFSSAGALIDGKTFDVDKTSDDSAAEHVLLKLPASDAAKTVSIHGTVTTPRGPLKDGLIEIVSWSDDGPAVFAAQSGADGKYQARAIAAPIITVRLKSDDFLAEQRILDAAPGTEHAEDLPVTSRLPPPNGVVVDFAAGAVVLDTTHPTQPVGNLDDVLPLIDEAQVLGLGESNPGTSELVSVRQRLIERFHAAGYDHLALPFTADQVDALKSWVTDKTDTEAEAGASEFLQSLDDPFWYSEEARRLLLWIRSLHQDPETASMELLAHGDGSDATAILQAAKDGKKVLVWGHNRQISRQGSLGKALADGLGDGYVAWGGFFNQGAFMAQRPGSDELERVWVGPTPRSYLEGILNRLGGKLAVQSLRGIEPGSEPGRWLDTPRVLRDQDGTFYGEKSSRRSLRLLDHFDGLFFVESTTKATPLG